MIQKMLQPARLLKGVEILLAAQHKSLSRAPQKMKGDASTRQYFRIFSEDTSFIAMLLPEQRMGYGAEEITKTSRDISELPFIDVQRYLKQKGVRVPQIFGYEEKLGVLLLEDLGDRLLLDFAKSENPENIQFHYEHALEELLKLSIVPETTDRKDSILFARRFDEDLYNLEFLHFIEYGLDRNLQTPLSPKDRNLIFEELKKLTDFYISMDLVVCHRDYHSRNLLVLNQKEKIGVIDFQDALLAPLFYDLASLLRDSYYTLNPTMQNELLEHHRTSILSQGFKNTDTQETFRRAFDFMGIHRNLKAAGRFCFFDIEKNNPNYLPDVPRTLNYVQETLDRYEELNTLKNLLSNPFQEISERCHS